MISAWTKHLQTEEEKTRFKNSVLGSKIVLERLKELIIEEEADVESSELSVKNYDIPNWAYLQADRNGYRRALKSIRKLITIDQ